MDGWYPQNCKGASLSLLGYHWLPLATIDLVGDNREFEVEGIFWTVIPIMDALIVSEL